MEYSSTRLALLILSTVVLLQNYTMLLLAENW